jgi:hypothetical protein
MQTQEKIILLPNKLNLVFYQTYVINLKYLCILHPFRIIRVIAFFELYPKIRVNCILGFGNYRRSGNINPLRAAVGASGGKVEDGGTDLPHLRRGGCPGG